MYTCVSSLSIHAPPMYVCMIIHTYIFRDYVYESRNSRMSESGGERVSERVSSQVY